MSNFEVLRGNIEQIKNDKHQQQIAEQKAMQAQLQEEQQQQRANALLAKTWREIVTALISNDVEPDTQLSGLGFYSPSRLVEDRGPWLSRIVRRNSISPSPTIEAWYTGYHYGRRELTGRSYEYGTNRYDDVYTIYSDHYYMLTDGRVAVVELLPGRPIPEHPFVRTVFQPENLEATERFDIALANFVIEKGLA